MKSTNTTQNIELAQELLTLRRNLKDMQKREKELKDYFSKLIGNDDSLKVSTAITISKHEQSRSSFDTKLVESYLLANKQNVDNFKKTTTFNIIKIA
jgi:hypothetical protein